MTHSLVSIFFFFFNDTATTEIYTLSLHDALPIYVVRVAAPPRLAPLVDVNGSTAPRRRRTVGVSRSEEHTSELQSPCNLVCRLLLEKKKKNQYTAIRRLRHGARCMTSTVRCYSRL